MAGRILHIIDSLRLDGTTRQLLLLSQSLVKNGWEVHVAARRGGRRWPARSIQAEFAASGIAVASLGGRWPVDPLAQLRLVRHVARLQPNVIHTWDCVPGLFNALAKRRRDSQRIITGHYRLDRSIPGWQWFMYRRLARRLDRIVNNGPTVNNWLIEQGLPSEKLAIIQPGVQPSPSAVLRGGAAPPTRNELLQELHLPNDAKLIGVIGRLIPEKRVKDLIWAADLLRVLHDNLRVLIIGDGPQRQQLERYAHMASDLVHIQFLGERGDVDRILPHFDVLWNGSENAGPSIAILEAMAAGVPVVASDTPSNRELVIENETGYLIPLGTRAGRAVRARNTDRIFTDPVQSDRLSNVSKQCSAQLFSVEQMVQRYSAVYDH